MQTIIVQIGNSDDKLTQKVWSKYCGEVNDVIKNYSKEIHFAAPSIGSLPWQNACWIFDIEDAFFHIDTLKEYLTNIRKNYHQDSVAWSVVEHTLFI